MRKILTISAIALTCSACAPTNQTAGGGGGATHEFLAMTQRLLAGAGGQVSPMVGDVGGTVLGHAVTASAPQQTAAAQQTVGAAASTAAAPAPVPASYAATQTAAASTPQNAAVIQQSGQPVAQNANGAAAPAPVAAAAPAASPFTFFGDVGLSILRNLN